MEKSEKNLLRIQINKILDDLKEYTLEQDDVKKDMALALLEEVYAEYKQYTI